MGSMLFFEKSKNALTPRVGLIFVYAILSHLVKLFFCNSSALTGQLGDHAKPTFNF